MDLGDDQKMKPVLDRFADGWARVISCGTGWHQIILDLDQELAAFSPDYKIYQIKEKFGLLRFYFTVGDEEYLEGLPRDVVYENMNALVAIAESKSGGVCEICGHQPAIRRNMNWIRTLCDECHQQALVKQR